MPVQHRMHGTDGGQRDLRVPPFDLLADLRSSPAGVLLLQLHDQLLDLKRQSIGMTVRTARPVGQPLHPAVFVAREDFVACFAGDIELPAQHRHLLPVQQPSHKTQPLVHLVTLPPRHLGSPKCPKVLPMCPEWSVTYVPESTPPSCLLSAAP